MAITTDAADGTTGVISSLGTWFSQPFSTQMSVKGWALFTGLILVLCVLWIIVLHEIRGEI